MLKLKKSLTPKRIKGKRIRPTSFYVMLGCATILAASGLLLCIFSIIALFLCECVALFLLFMAFSTSNDVRLIIGDKALYFFDAFVSTFKEGKYKVKRDTRTSGSMAYSDIAKVKFDPEYYKIGLPFSPKSAILIYGEDFKVILHGSKFVLPKIKERIRRISAIEACPDYGRPAPALELWFDLSTNYDTEIVGRDWGDQIEVDNLEFDHGEVADENDYITFSLTNELQSVTFVFDRFELYVYYVDEDVEESIALASFADKEELFAYMIGCVDNIPEDIEE